MKHPLIDAIEKQNADQEFPELYPGDQVNVYVNVVEGDRSRVQRFSGTIIRNRSTGQSRTFTVRRIASHGIGVERTFLYKSPRIESIEVLRHNKVRRAQLYYMRDRRGKSARMVEVRQVNRNKPKSQAAYDRVAAPEPVQEQEAAAEE
jgi:large subunit ribosomal protein L19